MKDKGTTHKETRRETTSDKTVGKKRRSTWWHNKESSANVPIRVKRQIEPMEWHRSDAVPAEPNTTKKKAPPDRTSIKPNKGSALPSKGKKKEQVPIESQCQKDKTLSLKEDQ